MIKCYIMMLKIIIIVMSIHICMMLKMKKIKKTTHICMISAVNAEVKINYKLNSL